MTPDNVLYSPWIDIPRKGTTSLRFWARGTDIDDYSERFTIWYKIKDGDNSIHMFEDAIYTTENKWNEYTVDISAAGDGALKGKSVCIIIRHYDCTDQLYLVIDDFHVTNVGAPVTVYSFDFESDPFENGRTTLSIWARGCDSNDYAETFEICYLYNYGSDSGSVTGLQSAAFTTTNEWKEYTVDIYPWLAGEQVRFIIRHCSCTDQLRLYIDDLSIKNTKTSVMKGDLDKDGEITVGDALIALRIAAKLLEATEEDVLIGDVDNDGDISVSDALKILRVAAKLEARSALG